MYLWDPGKFIINVSGNPQNVWLQGDIYYFCKVALELWFIRKLFIVGGNIHRRHYITRFLNFLFTLMNSLAWEVVIKP